MPRKMRVEYEGAMYHVMSRGDRREDIFLDDVDRHDFLKTLAEACQKAGWQVHAYCLMRNHYHLVVETPDANLVAGMAWLQSTYTIRLNHRHKLFGHVFSGRYKAQLVEGNGNVRELNAVQLPLRGPVLSRCLQSEGQASRQHAKKPCFFARFLTCSRPGHPTSCHAENTGFIWNGRRDAT